ncbi:riboflavin kinase [Rhizodiscina lignyota]|uniref:Riboflavin kinase n=1 Tax=Rhizodiscina lignyota TaxID=1504668 RepID=A0A9P4ICB6_9PEZI|nr:riboflavin kinase [Rhizodiscina lignyota]
MRPDGARDPIVGPDSGPLPPFPLKLSGKVIKGFGRGSKELGIPTANIPIEGLNMIAGDEADDAEEGWDGKGRVHPMVMSVGWNPYYKNEVRSVEVHIMHNFTHDFYGSHLNLIMLGFIRPEYDYVSKESLIEDIKTDIEVAGKSLARPAWAKYRKDKCLLDFPEAQEKDVKADGKA